MSSTLLGRLRLREPEAWERLTGLFGPLAYGWCRRAGLAPADAADVTQEVFRAVARSLDRFRRDRPGDSFRGWLAVICRNKIRDHYRRVATRPEVLGGTDFQQRLADLPDAESDDSLVGSSPGSEESRGVLHRAVALIQTDFEEKTWRAFWETAVEDRSAADVAGELRLSVNAVYKAKSRVLRRLRDELGGLIV